jgi:4-hydroxythreonine-4-phosphate dehydrogenase
LALPLPATWRTTQQLLENQASFTTTGAIGIDCHVITQRIFPGRPTRLAGQASYRYLEVAIAAARKRKVAAITTAPITKTTLKLADVEEPGHTEIFARQTSTANFAMMLYSPRIAVSFVTCHQSFESVPATLTTEDIVRVTELSAQMLRRIRGHEPALAILGLNPHAGEAGLFGRQEIEIIAPAVEQCRAKGLNVTGPIPPDAAFMPQALERFDGHVTMYHDQGSIPFKMISLHDGVNITMGLPIIRTSVDHGTAYDIAWQGKAEVTSMLSAVSLAAQLAMQLPPAQSVSDQASFPVEHQ